MLFRSIVEGSLSSTMAKVVFEEMLSSGKNADDIIREKGLVQITDTEKIATIAKEIIAQNPKAVEDYKKGKENALQFLVGQLMSKTKGTVNPETTRAILGELLKKN